MNSSATEISSSHRPKEERSVLENTSRKLAQELQQTKLKLKKIEQENMVLQSKNSSLKNKISQYNFKVQNKKLKRSKYNFPRVKYSVNYQRRP